MGNVDSTTIHTYIVRSVTRVARVHVHDASVAIDAFLKFVFMTDVCTHVSDGLDQRD